ncbi:hypothetical protein GGR51DRAFT_121489 [Nemania sp. FL0031]|nr:hypothetical protein GGR51DRAFT_121489 [Nemania sp. FL0031]
MLMWCRCRQKSCSNEPPIIVQSYFYSRCKCSKLFCASVIQTKEIKSGGVVLIQHKEIGNRVTRAGSSSGGAGVDPAVSRRLVVSAAALVAFFVTVLVVARAAKASFLVIIVTILVVAAATKAALVILVIAVLVVATSAEAQRLRAGRESEGSHCNCGGCGE